MPWGKPNSYIYDGRKRQQNTIFGAQNSTVNTGKHEYLIDFLVALFIDWLVSHSLSVFGPKCHRVRWIAFIEPLGLA